MTYLELSDADQVEALRPAALAAAEQFGLDVHRLEMVLHAYNTTFEVETVAASGEPRGRRFALRVNTNSSSTPAQVAAQQAWQLAIAEQTTVLVPEPLRTADGGWFAEVEAPGFGRPVLVTCASWLDGPDVVEPDAEVARELGRAMARLHQQATTWPLPDGAAMPTFDSPLFGDDDLLDTATGLTAEQRATIDEGRRLTSAAFARVYAGAPVIALHADLHGGNVKWHEGRLAVFDFDDCGFGVPALDLAVSTFYLRHGDPAPEEAMRAGYAEVAPLPRVPEADFEAMVASRQLLLANAMLGSTTADLRAGIETYLPLTADRLRHWMDTGRFQRVLPEPEAR